MLFDLNRRINPPPASSQLFNYDPAKDWQGQPKNPQDLICMLSMLSFIVREWFYVDLKDEDKDPSENAGHRYRTARLSIRSPGKRSSSR
jgi:hypothetical protein